MDRDPPDRDPLDRDPPGQRPLCGQRHPLYGKERAVRILLERSLDQLIEGPFTLSVSDAIRLSVYSDIIVYFISCFTVGDSSLKF